MVLKTGLGCLVLCLALVAQAATPPPEDYTLKLALQPGLVIAYPIYGGKDLSGKLIGDYDFIARITTVRGRAFTYTWSFSYPSNTSGDRRFEEADIRNSRRVSVYFGPAHDLPGYSDVLRISDAIFSDLKYGKETAFQFDGPENPGTIRPIGSETFDVLVNDRHVTVRTVKGRAANGWTFWVLDNPAFPIVLKGEASWKWAPPTFTYANAGQLLAAELKSSGEAVSHAVLFSFNSSQIQPDSLAVLEELAAFMKKQPGRLEIQGHTDNIGGTTFNDRLSQARADSVKACLVQQGVDGARLTAKGLGFRANVADNATPEGRALNRRVVFRMLE